MDTVKQTARRDHHGAPSFFRNRILVAEQDVEVRRAMVDGLRLDGHKVIEMTNGVEVLEHLGDALLIGRLADRPDAIIMDVLIPGIHGLSILGGLRDAGWLIPIVLVAAQRGCALEEESARLGGSAMFARPFSIDDLRTFILNVVPGRATSRSSLARYRALSMRKEARRRVPNDNVRVMDGDVAVPFQAERSYRWMRR